MMRQRYKPTDLMITIILISLLAGISFSDSSSKKQGTLEEICQYETFQPRCPKTEVILVKSATYGRMRTGRCITDEEIADLKRLNSDESIRYIGCSINVVSHLHRRCSGKSECDVRVSDIASENVKPCISFLAVYLAVEYNCIAVADERRSCALTVSSSPIHIISSSSPNALGALCGTKSQPWVVEAPIGQKISIRLLSFASQSQLGNRRETNSCSSSYGIIVDKVGNKNTSICESTQQDTQLTTTSINKAYIFLRQNEQGKELSEEVPIFILKLQAIGCSDIIPPEDTWLKRRNDEIAIGCYSSRQTWFLNCQDGKWFGVLGNCSQNAKPEGDSVEVSERLTSQEDELGSILGIVAIVGFTLAICMVIVGVGMMCIRRMHRSAKQRQDYRTLNFQINSVKDQSSERRFPLTDTDVQGMDSTQPFPLYSLYAEDANTSIRDIKIIQSA